MLITDQKEYSQVLDTIIQHLKYSQELAKRLGLNNLSQPGVVKEIIMANALGHKVQTSKHLHDAESFTDSEERYEYLTCLDGGSFQLDRVSEENLEMIETRNKYVYCGIFNKAEPLHLEQIYELDPSRLYKFMLDKYSASSSTSRHVNVRLKDILAKGILTERKQPVWQTQYRNDAI